MRHKDGTGWDGWEAGGLTRCRPESGEGVSEFVVKDGKTRARSRFFSFFPPSFPPSEVSLTGHSLRWVGCGRDQQFLVVVSALVET